MKSSTAIQVLCLGHSGEVEQSLRSLLSTVPDLLNVEMAADTQAMFELLESRHADVLLIDLGTENVDAIDVAKRMRKSHPKVRVLVCTASDEPSDIFAAMDAGADGYVLKGHLSKSLAMAISSVRLGAVWLDPAIAKQVLDVVEKTSNLSSARILPTGVMRMPLLPFEREILNDVAESNCADGVCLVDPSFLKKLRRFARSTKEIVKSN